MPRRLAVQKFQPKMIGGIPVEETAAAVAASSEGDRAKNGRWPFRS